MQRSMNEKPVDGEKRIGHWFQKAAHPLPKIKERIVHACKTVLKTVSNKTLDQQIPQDDTMLRDGETSQDQVALETNGMEPWKTKVLDDFKDWLSQVPDQDQATGTFSVTPDTCDLYTLFSEFTALKQEIKMQNREQHRTLKALSQITAMTDAYQQVMERFDEKTRQIAQLEQNVRMETEKRTVSYFLDIRDSLVRGKSACCAPVNKKRFFRQPPQNTDNICDGYDMAIRKFDASLALLDIYPVASTGAVFDPASMKALESRVTDGVEKGVVVQTVACGFKRGERILRYAQVIVAG